MSSDPEEIYRQEYPGLLRFAFLVAGDRDQAEDAVADAVTSVWPRLGVDIDEPGKFLRRAVANRLIDLDRRSGAQSRALRRLVPAVEPPVDGAVVEHQILTNEMALLPVEQRAVMVCRFFHGLSVDETAAMLGIPPGTVKSRMHRGLASLRIALSTNDRPSPNPPIEGTSRVS